MLLSAPILRQVYNPALSVVFLDLRILNELRAQFSEVRILKGLRLKRVFATGRQRNRGRRHAFELLLEITWEMVPYW